MRLISSLKKKKKKKEGENIEDSLPKKKKRVDTCLKRSAMGKRSQGSKAGGRQRCRWSTTLLS